MKRYLQQIHSTKAHPQYINYKRPAIQKQSWQDIWEDIHKMNEAEVLSLIANWENGNQSYSTTPLCLYWASVVSQTLKILPSMPETQCRSLGWADPQEKGMATHSTILVWRIPGTEEPSELQSMGSERVGYNWVTNPLNFSCLCYKS